MLIFDNVTLRVGDFTLTADAHVGPGLTAVIGPSGGGKSTLLSAIAGFLDTAAGQIAWDGRDLSGRAPGDRPVTMLFQDNNLFPHLTVAQNVGLALGPRLRMSAAETSRIADVLRRVGLGDLGRRKPAALSGGQQSRAALARVLLADLPVVLLDEAFAALGPALRAEMLELVHRTLVQAGRTVLMVTHDPSDARAWADQVILVADGVVQPPRPASALFADPPAALRAYLGT
ncbi:thiamine ABC transporter ATP-binding protein [Loktanella sp. 3ANDIMAR09]|uniref:thiamine ABC transporter ATP-binding protein n=1 Tax=Loktanella sp. 3ANDIMAR09 TaxID=1225657 RepID=UPI0006F81DEF|nr:ATP-binding cassette domain-containing protein [Loktanella sp. 3ANDIMAR09]KQI70254.1 thiamine ABC transporter ATP-binding protein [Loktanella sp. 3ANDIMAR09]